MNYLLRIPFWSHGGALEPIPAIYDKGREHPGQLANLSQGHI